MNGWTMDILCNIFMFTTEYQFTTMYVTFSCQDGISGWLCEEMSGEGLSLDQMDVSGILTPFYLVNKQKIKERKRNRRNKQNLFLDQIDNGFNCRQHTSPPRGPGWQDHCCGNVASPGGNCGHEGELQVDLDGGATMIIMEKMMMAVGKTVMMTTMEGQLRL